MTLGDRVAKIEIELASVREITSNSNRRIDGHENEIGNLRHARHEHNGLLQNHSGILSGITNSITVLSDNVQKLTTFSNRLIWVTVGGVGTVSIIGSIIVYLINTAIKLLL